MLVSANREIIYLLIASIKTSNVPTLREGNRRFPSAVAGWKLPGEMESSDRRFHPPGRATNWNKRKV